MEKDALRFGCYPQSPRPQAAGSLGAEYEEDLGNRSGAKLVICQQWMNAVGDVCVFCSEARPCLYVK